MTSEGIDYGSACTEACWAMPDCSVCGKCKAPKGRSVPLESGAAYCDWDCPGYTQDPKPGHYWPGEEADNKHGVTS